ncbi:MAG: hypothetical protein QOH68_2113 [Nocardioidaceae bacterium]|jgi:hypothetical protein|nr:hypothetical protein [Nocardioidaceae bacterium]
MDRSTAARLGIAGAVAGAGLAAGGIAMASAESTADTPASSPSHPGGLRGDRGQIAEVLAKELGLDKDVVQKALDDVRDELRPDTSKSTDDSKSRPSPPTAAERTERQAALAKALAKELGVSEAKVKGALAVANKQADADRQERRADSRADLVTRLDAAVKAGTLTKSDKASVLKAFDAKLIGGFGGGIRGQR